jgi:hypothetical protein
MTTPGDRVAGRRGGRAFHAVRPEAFNYVWGILALAVLYGLVLGLVVLVVTAFRAVASRV